MRKTATLDALFPRIRQGILSATLGQPDKWWFLSELAKYLETTPSSLQRELSALVETGILEQRREGTRAYFRAEKQSPIFRDLQRIIEKTAGIVPTIQTVLEPFGEKILFAFVYGSIARAQEYVTSDIDLMIIGRAGLAELTPALRKVERVLGRELNVTNYSAEEFREQLENNDHFLTSVLRRPKQLDRKSVV